VQPDVRARFGGLALPVCTLPVCTLPVCALAACTLPATGVAPRARCGGSAARQRRSAAGVNRRAVVNAAGVAPPARCGASAARQRREASVTGTSTA